MKKITWGQIVKLWPRKSGKTSQQPLSEEAKKYILDDIDLTANAFAFKFEPTDFNEAMKKFAPSTSKKVEPEQDEEWREIPGYPDYKINRTGRVRFLQSRLDVAHWVNLRNDELECDELRSVNYLVAQAFPPAPAFKFETDIADDFVHRSMVMDRTEMQAQELAKAFNNNYGVVISSEPPKITPLICKHCNRQIEYKNGGFLHAEGLNRNKQRCDPHDSQLVYGYNADPVGAECSEICLGHKEEG